MNATSLLTNTDVMHRLKGGTVNTPHRTDIFEVRLMTETVPNRHSEVDLIDEKDTLGMKKASLNWKLSRQDKFIFSSIANLAKKYFKKEENVDLILADWLNDDSIDWTQFINKDGHFGHHMGTTKMGASIQNSVVDENCKLHGYSNIYLSGSSVFPTFGFANPTLTVIALSIRLGDHLKKMINKARASK